MENTHTKAKLNQHLLLVHDLLNKQKLIENMVHLHESRKHELVESLVQRQHLAELDSKLRRLHPGDLAYILEVLPMEDRLRIWDLIQERRGGEIFLELSDAVRKSLIDTMSNEQLLQILNQLDGDDLAYIADEIDDDILQQRLQSLSAEDQNWFNSAMEFEEDSVGSLMTNEMVIIRETDTLEQAAKHLRELHELPAHNDKLFVIDRRGILQGVLTLQSILLNDPQKPVNEIMAREVVKFTPEDDASEASKAFERYDLISAPVVNQRGKLIGRLTVDMVMDYIREESTEDVLNMAGIRAEEDMFSSIMDSARNRGTWLIINLFTAFIASHVIGLFENTISKLVILASLMPIVASVGGNTGNQTTALIVRALSQGQINASNTLYMLRKEIGVSSINGLMLGCIVGLITLLFYHSMSLALVISGAMLLTLVIAAIVGLAIPLLLEKYGRDPALGSSVLLTATTDSIGFFVFLGLATLFLL
jgi:magnesium transporter